jgi:hypothetical protein
MSNGKCQKIPRLAYTPHHAVPDHCFKQPGSNGTRYVENFGYGDGLAICVTGKTKSSGAQGGRIRGKGKRLIEYYRQLAQHGQIHARFDAIEATLGKIGNPQGTATIGQLEDVGAGVIAKVTGCNKEDLKRQLREKHQAKGLPANTKLRADPLGSIKNLNHVDMSVPNKSSGGSGISL